MVGDPAGGLEELLLLVEDEEVVAGAADAAQLVLLEGQRVLLTRALGAHNLKNHEMICMVLTEFPIPSFIEFF